MSAAAIEVTRKTTSEVGEEFPALARDMKRARIVASLHVRSQRASVLVDEYDNGRVAFSYGSRALFKRYERQRARGEK